MFRQWKLARRNLVYGSRTMVMGVLNVTPDSFSDGGQFFSVERAVAHAEQMIRDGADLIDVGGESTRPRAEAVAESEELRRVIPVIEALSAKSTAAISVDTTKSSVARAALLAGAEIVNDISGLRFDRRIAEEVATANAGLILMHSRGTPKNMQELPVAPNILGQVIEKLSESARIAQEFGVRPESLAVDPGIGFGKTAAQNLELIARLREVSSRFPDFPLVIGASRKSFIGKLLDDAPVDKRLFGTIASTVAAALNGAHIVRVHDVKPAVEALRIADAIRNTLIQNPPSSADGP